MGEPGMGYKDIGADGLGISGLGANVHFGTPHAAMAEVFDSLRDSGMRFNFVIFESCESQVDKSDKLKSQLRSQAIDGYYSANGSLWYRNYDWYDILPRVSRASEQGRLATKILASWSKEVPTYVAVPTDSDAER
jgi:hypothetical protein